MGNISVSFKEFAQKYFYGKGSEEDERELRETLQKQKETYNPEGWFLLECPMMGSSHMGEHTILPYGPNNTFKNVPDHPVSPRGLASDMAVVVAVLTKENFGEN